MTDTIHETIPAPRYGANLWARRMRMGNKRHFQHPGDLAEAAAQYFEWMEENPLYEQQAWHYQGEVITHANPKMRAFTWQGFAAFCGVSVSAIRNRKNEEDFAPVIEAIEECFFAQKFEGAAAGLLSSNIVSRDLGLAEKQEMSGPGGAPLQAVIQYQLPENGRDEPEGP